MLHFFSIRKTIAKALKFANFPAIERITGEKIFTKQYVSLFFKIILVVLITLSLAGTRIVYETKTSNTDFVIAIDSSSSMLATDLKPNRLEAAKEAAKIFVKTTDGNINIGIISFAGLSFIKERVTDNVESLLRSIDNISVEKMGGTSISSAIITAVNLLENRERARAIILLTDGRNTVGPDIEEAVDYAKEKGVRVYTVGIGSEEGENIPGTKFTTQLDEETLMFIANQTKGKYFKIKNFEELKNVYKDIALKDYKTIFINVSTILLLFSFILLLTNWVLNAFLYGTL